MTTLKPPLCAMCSRLNVEDYSCAAFPDGIPEAILTNKHDHRKPYKGDHGILFDPLREGDPIFDPFEVHAVPS